MNIEYSQGNFSAKDIIKHLNLTGRGNAIYAEIIKSRETVKKAESLSLTVSEDDLQKQIDNFRIVLGLHSAADTLEFLNRAGLTIEDLEAFCESALLIEAVKNHLADEAKIEAYFVNNRTEFDLARISIAMVRDENLANEIVLQVTEEDEDFHALARTYSVDESTKYAGGYVGFVSRGTFSAEIAAKVFNAVPGELLGPFVADGAFQLILVEELIKPELDGRLKELIKEKIFEGWISKFMGEGVHCTA